MSPKYFIGIANNLVIEYRKQRTWGVLNIFFDILDEGKLGNLSQKHVDIMIRELIYL